MIAKFISILKDNRKQWMIITVRKVTVNEFYSMYNGTPVDWFFF